MRNVWKGLVVGALTGMAGGAAMDIASADRRKTAEVAHDLMEEAPSVAKAVTDKATDVLDDADVPGTVRDVAQKVGESDGAKKAKKVAKQVAADLDTNTGRPNHSPADS
jgi:hypothetical protein